MSDRLITFGIISVLGVAKLAYEYRKYRKSIDQLKAREIVFHKKGDDFKHGYLFLNQQEAKKLVEEILTWHPESDKSDEQSIYRLNGI